MVGGWRENWKGGGEKLGGGDEGGRDGDEKMVVAVVVDECVEQGNAGGWVVEGGLGV